MENSRKRKREALDAEKYKHTHQAPLGYGGEDDEGDEEGKEQAYEGPAECLQAIHSAFKSAPHVSFIGQYELDLDPLKTAKEEVRMVSHEIWQASGYKFRVHDNPKIATGYKTRYWCCQDEGRRQRSRPSQREGAVPRDNVGMKRFACRSRLIIACKLAAPKGGVSLKRTIRIAIEHHTVHVLYYDVSVPAEALDMVRENLDNATPNELVGRIQALFPQVTANQIHTAWTVMSEELWKRDDQQLTSAKLLMEDLSDDVEMFNVVIEDGIEQICWGMKQIARPLIGKVVEVGLDATFETNSRHLELYSVLAEFDNAGFLLSYCLLSTASAIEIGKRTRALTRWTTMLRDRYCLNPEFVHVDKDMAEISMSRTVWASAKIQLCWWHLRKALRERLSRAKLTTTPYNVEKAVGEFTFIDRGFIPFGRTDSGEHEGGQVDSDTVEMEMSTQENPNAVYLRITKAQRLPARVLPETATASENANDDHSCRIFCPDDLRVQLVDMVELHFCAHPLIPGYAAPSAPGIRHWAVKQMYDFCVANDLREAWAYLWENWYRKGRWELWARCEYERIPRLKTTMILESHWRRIKKDFLHHFHKPRVDLLVWILVTKMAPAYYRKLDLATRDIGRFRELPSWRKAFKRDWKRALKKPITVPLNIKYRPDTYRWVCTCPHFSKSRFLLCKHLVQAAPPVEPIFFLEVIRNRTTPFWTHVSLQPMTDETKPGVKQPAQQPCEDVDSSDESESDEGACHQLFVAFEDQMKKRIDLLRDFAYGLEYQIQFRDHRFLQTVERQGGALFRLAEACQGSYSPTASSSPNVTSSASLHSLNAARALVLEYEESFSKAEQARDEAEAQRRMMLGHWQQLERYLQGLEFHASDARAGFARILLAILIFVYDGASVYQGPTPKQFYRLDGIDKQSYYPLSLIVTTSSSPGSRVRNRDSSMDEASQPPPKKPRIVYAEPSNSPHLSNAQYAQQQSYGTPTLHAISRKDAMHVQYVDQHGQPIAPSKHEYPSPYPPPHTIQARLINDRYGASLNLHHPRSRSRSRSSSAESENIDELLLAATDDGNQPQFPHGNPNHPNPPHQQPRSNGQVVNGIHHHGHHPATHSPNAPPYQPHHPSLLPQPGQVQTYQTHVFAPVVTGAPVKKSKFGASGSSSNLTANGSQSQGDVNGVQSAPPPPSFPPANAQGQRICRQCGLPGRYKEGKCVEKWGPGPEGPGTVCDRWVMMLAIRSLLRPSEHIARSARKVRSTSDGQKAASTFVSA
ncbi:hypothetical protein PC9H_009022 [Pleurotus ostreatus]|uniref:SWIM-type domain-containing protein n=1 Tax=Pleurotus ostreatus TaxID=5322 RepID=A0A8H6ZPY0_PLEOS|nr:uncharacterized protein PC9H_009022 [Pleurotus ostreatus]KAF7426653.1 hypothetical protein PC9H_009022 [Pleurotus ostreatus]